MGNNRNSSLFIKFLKTNNIQRKFFKEAKQALKHDYRHCIKCRLSALRYRKLLLLEEPERIIRVSLNYKNTADGLAYWVNINKLWLQYLSQF